MTAVRRMVTAAGARLAAADRWDIATILLIVGLTVVVMATVDAYAISNDEEAQRRYGQMIIAYYRSGFTDQALFHFKNLYLYGGLFDVLAELIARILPALDPFAIRHVLCALTGIAGIVAAGATARLVAGPRAGALAALTLTVCGPWYGSMFNHTKDIPFAAAMAGATYLLLRTMRDLPRPRQRDAIGFGLLLGVALGIRVLGLLLVIYAGLAIAMRMRQAGSASLRQGLALFSRSAIALTPALLIGYAVMAAAWPWSVLSPLNPARGLLAFGAFDYPIRTVLDGQIYDMANVPRWYVPVYLLVKLPLVMLVGAAIAMIVAAWRGRQGWPNRRAETALIAATTILPVLCEVVDRGPAFTGLRHFLFVVPAGAALAGIGFDWLLRQVAVGHRRAAAALQPVLLAALAWNGYTLVQLHPYEYLFYNPLVGGLEGASGRYVTDYWVNIMPEAVDELEAYVARLDRTGGHPNRYLVAVCGERLPFEKEAGSRLQWTDDWAKAEFFIAPTHMNCDRVLPGNVISTIDRLGARIGVIKDRRALVRSDLAQRR